MKISSIQPPPREITMTFPANEGWAVLAALNDWIERNPGAVDRDKWRKWAIDLERELKR